MKSGWWQISGAVPSWYHRADKNIAPVAIILNHKAQFYGWEEPVVYCI